jgi:hypothetical protein
MPRKDPLSSSRAETLEDESSMLFEMSKIKKRPAGPNIPEDLNPEIIRKKRGYFYCPILH